jgi:hypothetical protein
MFGDQTVPPERPGKGDVRRAVYTVGSPAPCYRIIRTLGANIQPSFQTNQFALADKTGYLDLGIGMMGKVMPQPQRVGNVNQFVLHIFSSKYILYILAGENMQATEDRTMEQVF